MKNFYETVIAEGGFAGEAFDVAQGPANTDVINTLLSVGDGTITANMPINVASTGALGAARSLTISSAEQNGRIFFLSVQNTDLDTNPLTITATTDINGNGASLVISSPTDYMFIHGSSGNWRAYLQNLDPVSDPFLAALR